MHSAFTTIASFVSKIRIGVEKGFSISDYFFQHFRGFGLMRVLFGFGFLSQIKWSTGMRNTFKSAVGNMSHCSLRAQPTCDENRVSSLGFALVRDALSTSLRYFHIEKGLHIIISLSIAW